jgi:cyanophycinase
VTVTLALFGGGPFVVNDDLDRSLLGAVSAAQVAVLPTADAFEDPAALVTAALSWAERLGVEVEALMVLHRQEADDAGAAAVVAAADAVYLVGDSSLHLRSTLKDTAVLGSIQSLLEGGGLVAAVGPSAAALCDPMLDQRGGAFTLGLGLARGVAVIPEAESFTADRLHRTRSLANTPLIELPTGSAAILADGQWTLHGDATAHGELPIAR